MKPQIASLLLVGFLISIYTFSGDQVRSKKVEAFGENPHDIMSPFWQRHQDCFESATVTELYASGIAQLKGASREEKKKSIIETMGNEPTYENTVSDLLIQHQIKIALDNQQAPEIARDKMWAYCMNFSLKEHYYKDDPIEKISKLDDIEGM